MTSVEGTGPSTRSIVVMGVAGSGKTTVARALAARLNFEFIDADWLHSPENIEKMSADQPLSDDDRLPWLHSVGRRIEGGMLGQRGTVTACSALKRSYRDVLRLYVPDLYFVYLEGSQELIHARIESRRREIVTGSLLASQFTTLEPLQEDERGARVDIRLSPEAIVNDVAAELAS